VVKCCSCVCSLSVFEFLKVAGMLTDKVTCQDYTKILLTNDWGNLITISSVVSVLNVSVSRLALERLSLEGSTSQ